MIYYFFARATYVYLVVAGADKSILNIYVSS